MADSPLDTDGALIDRIRRAMRDVPDFPTAGILFRDITPVLGDAGLFRATTDAMASRFSSSAVTHVAGIESRGFILAAPIAQRLDAGFVPIRKQGKLPWKTASRRYGLEYGTDRIEIHVDACPPGSRVLIVDDVLATGGTMKACCDLVRKLGGELVGAAVLIELTDLPGRDKLRDVPAVQSVIKY